VEGEGGTGRILKGMAVEAAARRRIAEQVVESAVEWIWMRQIQVSVRFFIRFYWSLTCCSAAGFGSVSEYSRAAAITVEGKGTRCKYQVSRIWR